MNRKIAILVAALIIPGGFVALFGAWLVKTLGQSERARLVMSRAQNRLPAWVTVWAGSLREAA